MQTGEKGRGGFLGAEAEGQGSAFPSGAGAMRLGLGVRDHRRGLESQLSSAEGGRATWAWRRGLTPPPPLPCPHPCAPCRRPSGIPEKDLRSAMAPYLLQQRDALQRRVQRQEAENRQLADAVLAGRRQLEELQLQAQARQQAWQVSAPARPSGPPSPVAAEEKLGPERASGVPRGGFCLSQSGSTLHSHGGSTPRDHCPVPLKCVLQNNF